MSKVAMNPSRKDLNEKNDRSPSKEGGKNSISDSDYAKDNSLAKIAEGELREVIKRKSTLHQLTFKLTTEYRDAITELANSRNEPVSEITRRALFAVLSNPILLDEVEDIEQEYRQNLGPSRHRK
ncbi:hypothetical protein [Salipiger thiooxidans]|uniref:hypothetical protein n=1 Tax=Salipiger thiooxidans TaxID=282683 RepID=UPI001CD1A1EF|nr:hypothetical protein [Salipiger thiooxidans]MCA0848108.1 hypothetical protein [Salipiger thiooxidans]